MAKCTASVRSARSVRATWRARAAAASRWSIRTRLTWLVGTGAEIVSATWSASSVASEVYWRLRRTRTATSTGTSSMIAQAPWVNLVMAITTVTTPVATAPPPLMRMPSASPVPVGGGGAGHAGLRQREAGEHPDGVERDQVGRRRPGRARPGRRDEARRGCRSRTPVGARAWRAGGACSVLGEEAGQPRKVGKLVLAASTRISNVTAARGRTVRRLRDALAIWERTVFLSPGTTCICWPATTGRGT